MNSAKKKEVDFGFPYKPYDIQTDFMKKLVETMEGKKIGIFESPTGTVSLKFKLIQRGNHSALYADLLLGYLIH